MFYNFRKYLNLLKKIPNFGPRNNNRSNNSIVASDTIIGVNEYTYDVYEFSGKITEWKKIGKLSKDTVNDLVRKLK